MKELYTTKRFLIHFKRSQDNLTLTVYPRPKTLQGRIQPLQMAAVKVPGWNKIITQRRKMHQLLLLKKITKNRNSTLQTALSAL